MDQAAALVSIQSTSVDQILETRDPLPNRRVRGIALLIGFSFVRP
jgi:hypothetical protein